MATFITPVEITPGIAGSWQDVDVSAHIPAGSTGVLLHVVKTYDPLAYDFGLRKKGSADNRINSIYGTDHFWAAIGVNASRIFQCYLGHATRIDVYLVGYFGAEAVFFDNAVDKSLATTDPWQNIDISANTGADTAVGAIFEVATSSTADWGLRKNGSTDNRLEGTRLHCWAIIGLDASELCQGQIGNTGTDFWLVGYIKGNATFITNATDISMGGTGVWADLAALPAGATGAIIEVLSWGGSGYTYYYGLRENGSAEDLYYRNVGQGHGFAFVEADAAGLIEGKISNANVDFYLVGYFTNPPPAPAITLLNPDHGAVGDSITITGTTFEAVQGTGTVTFNGVAATVTSWADTSIVVIVPVGATTGDVIVTNNSGDASAGVTWTLDPAPVATGSTTPVLGQQMHGLSAGAILGQPVVQA